jgi:alcohol dehydrogenase, propanol-preferring
MAGMKAVHKLDLARAVGAHEALLSDAGSADAIREIAGPEGAQAVFDFVGALATVAIASEVVGPDGEISVVGLGGGRVEAHTLDEAPRAYERLHEGTVAGRAVVLPKG